MSSEESARADLEFGTIPRLVAIRAERDPDVLAIVDADRTLTFAELAREVRRAAKGLLGLGVAHQECVAIWAPNLWEWIVAALAVHSVGGVVVPINTRYKGIEAAYLLEKSRARVLFTVSGFLDTDYPALLRKTKAELPHLAHVVMIRGTEAPGDLSWAEFLAGGDDISDADAERRAAAVGPDDLSDILFTSGTTGKPKGGMTSHAQSLRAFGVWADTATLAKGDRYLVALPFFHSFGYKAGWLACLLTGATVYPQAVFDVDVVLERIGREKITVMPGPPALYQSILAHPDLASSDISSLRLAVTGAAAIPVELIRRMREELRLEVVLTAYGMTEAAVITMCRKDDDAETIAKTSGRAIPGVEVRIVDAEGRALGPDETGEIQVRGFVVMKGYFDAEEETRKAIDADGWLHTGDVGSLDARGYIRITDRIKDMFIVGGFNAYPAEIENVLMSHEGIAEVAVIGVPDERMGEVGMAFVVPRPGARLTADEVIAWSRENMANFKVPRRVEICESLPRNATGKVLKTELRERTHG